MKAAAALSRRDQIRTQLADLKMPGALEARGMLRNSTSLR